jgi:eukaryotic translation initiation factor 2C
MANTDFIKRPEYGSLGKRIVLKANYFDIKTTPSTVYHYKVTITPEAPGRIAAFLIEDVKEQCKIIENQILVYDGGDNLFTADLLDFDDELKVVVSNIHVYNN